jgi:PAS domain S-box-containing protein
LTSIDESHKSRTESDSAFDMTRDVLFKISHSLLGSADRKGFLTVLNPAWEETLGFSIEALMAQPFIEFVHPSDRKATQSEMARLWTTEGLKTIDFRNRCAIKGGGWRWLSWQAEVLGESIYFVVHDVTEMIAAKHESHLMSRLVHGMDEAIFTMTTDGTVTCWNSSCEEVYGFKSEEALGRQLVDLTVPDDRQDEPATIVERLLGGEGFRQCTTQRMRKDDSLVTVSETASLIRDEEYNVRGVVIVGRDISDLKLEDTDVRSEFDMIAWVGRVRDAIDEDRIRFHAQPIVSVRGDAVSYELLCRIENRDGELIPPRRFLPAAEAYGLVEELDLLGVRKAAKLIADGHRVSVNISTATIRRRHIVGVIAEQLKNAGADPSGLTVEITETALMENMDDAERFTTDLSKLGVRVALDDFGTGFGGFTYLKRLPIDRLKIDVEFVRDLHSSRASQHVVKAVVALAQGFDLDTVAEGVEDEESAKMLVEFGVTHVQGHLFGEPEPVSEVVGRPTACATLLTGISR